MPLIKKLVSALSVINKIVLVVAVIVVVINLFLVHIQKTKPRTSTDMLIQSRKEIHARITDPELQKTKEGKLSLQIYRSGMCWMVGELCTDNPADADKLFETSLFGYIGKGIAMPYTNPPASGSYWVYESLQKTGFVPQAYAATGIGFASIQPLAEIWKLFRDISLLLIVLFLIVAGFLIMFKVKVNPQTIISIENTLPRVVITLLLIVFSFPIAGFLIDIMYLITHLAVSVIGTNSINPIPTEQQISLATNSGPGQLFSQVFMNGNAWLVGPAIFSFLPTAINVALRVVIVSGAFFLLRATLPPFRQVAEAETLKTVGMSTPVAWIITGVVMTLLAIFAPFLLSLFVIFFTGLLVFFRIFFLLFTAYIRILISIILSPIFLLLEAVPGRNMFGKWIKSLMADLILFPLTIVLLILSSIVVSLPVGNSLWQPPFLFGGGAQGFTVLVGMGILYIIPDIAKLVRGLFGIKGSPLKFGFGTFFAGMAAAGTAGLGGLGKFHSIGMTAGMVGNFLDKDSKLKGFLGKLSPYHK